MGTVICQGAEEVVIVMQSMSAKISFDTRPNEQTRIDFAPQGDQLSIVVINVDVPLNSPLDEISSSFVEKVGQTAQRKDIFLALYVHSRGQAKTRVVSYTFSA
jgi:hypothetical protein